MRIKEFRILISYLILHLVSALRILMPFESIQFHAGGHTKVSCLPSRIPSRMEHVNICNANRFIVKCLKDIIISAEISLAFAYALVLSEFPLQCVIHGMQNVFN